MYGRSRLYDRDGMDRVKYKKITPVSFAEHQFKMLQKVVDNLLINNKNFKYNDNNSWPTGNYDDRPYYFKHYTLPTYVTGPLKDQAEFIKTHIEQVGEILIDMMKDYEAELELVRREVSQYSDGSVS